MLTKTQQNQIPTLPKPYHEIKQKNTGKILGKMVSMDGSTKAAIQHRLNIAKTNWYKTRTTIFHNKILYVTTKLLLWNSLIRPTLTYALHTKQNKYNNINKTEQFSFNCIRQIDDPNWHQKEKNQAETYYTKN